MAYLAPKGYSPPADYNPADFIMDLVTTTEAEDGSADGKSTRQILIEAWDNSVTDEEASKALAGDITDRDDSDEESAENIKYMASYYTQFVTLFQRNVIISQSALVTNLTMFQTITVALICGLLWYQMPYTEDRISDRSGFIFFFMTYWFFMTLFQGMMQFIPERTIIIKERSSGSYRLSAYFLSKTITELPIRLFLPFLFLAICYPMAGMNPKPDIFFAIVSTQLLAALSGESIGLFIGTATMDYEKAMVIATVTSLALMLVGGFFVGNLPSWLTWLRYLSPFKYSYDACIQLEFDRKMPCDDGEVLAGCLNNPNGSVPGEEAIDFIGVTESVALNTGMLILFTFGFRFFAYLCLRFVPHNSGRV